MSELIGRIVAGRYRVEAFLGKGGMAEVYKVWDQNRSVYLAMKVLHADLAEDKVFIRRFRREAATLAKLQHPNIVRFYGLEQDGDLVFILMDYVEGTTLRKEIFQSKGPFSPQRVLEIMRPVCAALHYAHQSGFVHCDVKPANIMIHTNGTVLASDFGIARMTEAATATLVGAGTPAYMASEQTRGENPIPQTDIYALGIVLFEMLTGGERPFTGEQARTTGSTSEKIRWEQTHLEPPPLQKYNPRISPALEAVVLKCLKKEPTKRYASALELFKALQVAISAPPEIVQEQMPKPTQTKKLETIEPYVSKQSKQIVSPPARKRKPFVGLGITIVIILVGLALIFGGGSNNTIFSTVFPTLTNTHEPTSTPRPAPQHTPTLTPAHLGEAVRYRSIEITLLDVFRHDRIVPGGTYYYTPKLGHMVINLFVKVQNLGSDPVSIKWSDVYIVEETGDSWYPSWAGSKSVVKSEKVAPLSIDYHDVEGNDLIKFTDTVYLQVIYIIADKPEQTVLFGIADSPLIEFTVKK